MPDLGRSVLTEHWMAGSSTSNAASSMARQIDRVARQGGEGVQDALYMSEGACPADLAIPTPLGKWLPKYVSMLRIV